MPSRRADAKREQTPSETPEIAALSGQSLPSAVPQPASLEKAQPANEITIVDTAKGLRKLAKLLAAEAIIGLDTETAFFDPQDRNSKGKLALVQLSLPRQGITVLVDPIERCDEAAQDIRYRDLRSLRKALESSSLVKVAHSAGFDKKVLQAVGIDMPEIVDTQSLLRQIRPDIRQTSLRVACKYVLGVDVDKEQQTSAWHVRPLSVEQIKYAALDPELAFALHGALSSIVERAAWTRDLAMDRAMLALDGKLREIDRTIDEVAPELRVWEAREAAITEALRKRHPGGTPGYSGEHGAVYPGEPIHEVDRDALMTHFGALDLTPEQRRALDGALESATSSETSKGRIVAALKAAGGKSLGFSSIAELERFVDGFRTAHGPSKVHIEPAYRPAIAEPPLIDL